VDRSCEPMNKNRIEGAAEQGEWANNHEALVIKARWRRSGGCAVKECVLTWGDLALCLKGRRWKPAREVSRGHSSRKVKGRRNRRRSPLVIETGLSQMFAIAKLVDIVDVVKPLMLRQRETIFAEPIVRDFRCWGGINTTLVTSTIPTARCGPACRVVWEGLGQIIWPPLSRFDCLSVICLLIDFIKKIIKYTNISV